MFRAALLLVAALLPASLLAVPAVAAPSPESTYAAQAVKATNNQRVERGLSRLKKNACLQRFANRQARWMAAHGKLDHQDLGPILNRCRLRMVGENIAYGFPNGRAVVRGWMRSSQHRANILNRHYRHVAIAARKDGNGDWYVAQLFGRKR